MKKVSWRRRTAGRIVHFEIHQHPTDSDRIDDTSEFSETGSAHIPPEDGERLLLLHS